MKSEWTDKTECCNCGWIGEARDMKRSGIYIVCPKCECDECYDLEEEENDKD